MGYGGNRDEMELMDGLEGKWRMDGRSGQHDGTSEHTSQATLGYKPGDNGGSKMAKQEEVNFNRCPNQNRISGNRHSWRRWLAAVAEERSARAHTHIHTE